MEVRGRQVQIGGRTPRTVSVDRKGIREVKKERQAAALSTSG